MGFAATLWSYDAATGHLLNKRDADNKGADYSYDKARRPATRRWARTDSGQSARVTTTYAYTTWGDLDTVAYTHSSEDTPDLDYDYDRLGRIILVTQGTATTHAFEYGAATLALESEVIDYDVNRDGTVDLVREMVYRRDSFLRGTGYGIGEEGFTTAELGAGYGYDSAGRLDRVWQNPTFSGGLPQGTPAFTYSYRYSVSGGLHVGTGSALGGGVFDTGMRFHTAGPVHEVVDSFEIQSQRPRGQGERGEDRHRRLVGVFVCRERSGPANGVGTRPGLRCRWGRVSLVGRGLGVRRPGRAVEADHEFSGPRAGLQVRRHRQSQGNGGRDAHIDRHRRLHREQRERIHRGGGGTTGLARDDDGNLTGDGSLVYVWDAENRLVRVADGTDALAEYAYDYIGRRIAKSTGASAPQGRGEFVLLLRRLEPDRGIHLRGSRAQFRGGGSPTGADAGQSYTWGLDLSQSPQGAGGVGGLLVVAAIGRQDRDILSDLRRQRQRERIPGRLGRAGAHYEYDPFGNHSPSRAVA